MLLADVCLTSDVCHTTLKDKRWKVKVTGPLYSPPCWRVRQLQRWAWERVGCEKLLLFWNGFSEITSLFFVTDRKEQHFWNQWMFIRVPICKSSIFVMVMWPLFGTLHGPISAKCLVTDSRLKAHLQSLGFPSVPLVWSKTISCRLCAE